MISGERLQDQWSSGYYMLGGNLGSLLYGDVSVMRLIIKKTMSPLFLGCFLSDSVMRRLLKA